jgi:hypothetical protein
MRAFMFLFLMGCSFQLPELEDDPPKKPSRRSLDKGEAPSISWEEIKEAMDYCKSNGRVKRIYVNGKLICNNSARFFLSKKEKK